MESAGHSGRLYEEQQKKPFSLTEENKSKTKERLLWKKECLEKADWKFPPSG
jgi:hypothetical protein